MNGQVCCILGVCCDPGGGDQRAALEKWLAEKLTTTGLTSEVCAETAKSWVAELYVKE